MIANNQNEILSHRTILEREMTSGRDLRLGKYFMRPTSEFTWNPDKLPNPHMLIWGKSRSGKSRYMKKAIEYCALRGKTLHIVDLHGDLALDTEKLKLPPENLIELKIKNSEFGINPFEFERNTEYGGPTIQAKLIIKMFKKTFMPDMGSKQQTALENLIRDTYRYKGIIEENVDTWNLHIKDKREWGKTLPTMQEMKDLLEHIRESLRTGFSISFTKVIKKNGRKLQEYYSSLNEYQKVIETLKEKRTPELIELYTQITIINKDILKIEDSINANIKDSGEQTSECDELLELPSPKKKNPKKLDTQESSDLEAFYSEHLALSKRINAILEQNDALKKSEDEISRLFLKIRTIKLKIREGKYELSQYFDEYIDFTYLNGDSPKYIQLLKDNAYDFLNLKEYADVSRILDDISFYLTSLVSSGIFHNQILKISAGVNRYYLNNLPKEAQTFFIEDLIEKVLRSLKLRGEYHKLPIRGDKYSFFSRIEQTKFDTILFIDELQVITPDDKNDRESVDYILNQFGAEVGKYGGALCVASQRPINFPLALVSNVATKVGFNTSANDIKDVVNLFGVKDKDIFEHIKRFGVAMVNDKHDKFESVALPWLDTEGLR